MPFTGARGFLIQFSQAGGYDGGQLKLDSAPGGIFFQTLLAPPPLLQSFALKLFWKMCERVHQSPPFLVLVFVTGSCEKVFEFWFLLQVHVRKYNSLQIKLSP